MVLRLTLAAPRSSEFEVPISVTTPSNHARDNPGASPLHPANIESGALQHVQHPVRGLVSKQRVAAKDRLNSPRVFNPNVKDKDIHACLDDFKSSIAYADGLSEADREAVLLKAFAASSPNHPRAWEYNVLVIEHLAHMRWDFTPLFAGPQLASFAIPSFYTPECKVLLNSAEEVTIHFPQRRRRIRRLYMKIAESASSTTISSASSKDSRLLHMTRLLWQSAASPGGQVERSALDLLRVMSKKLHDRDTAASLHTMLAHPFKLQHGIIQLIVSLSEHPDRYDITEQVLHCIPQDRLSAANNTITRDLASTKAKEPSVVDWTRLSTWLKLLLGLDSNTASTARPSEHFDTAIARIAKIFFANQGRLVIYPQTLIRSLMLKISQTHPAYTTSEQAISRLMDASRRTHLQPEQDLGRLLSTLRGQSLPCMELARAVTALIVCHAKLGSVQNFLSILEDQKFTLEDTSVIVDLVEQKMVEIQHPDYTLTGGGRQRAANILHMCQTISETLSRVAAASTAEVSNAKKDYVFSLRAQRQFQHILDGAQAARALPLIHGRLSANWTPELKVTLVHQLAHQYSLDRTRSHRETWRSMYYLYNYLKQNAHPIGPLFSKAVVRVCITRALAEHRFVSAGRLIWVCQLVALVEGEKVARQLEFRFWQWRGDLIKEAKAAFVESGGDASAKASISTMKRLGLI